METPNAGHDTSLLITKHSPKAMPMSIVGSISTPSSLHRLYVMALASLLHHKMAVYLYHFIRQSLP